MSSYDDDDTSRWALLLPVLPFAFFLLLLGGMRVEDAEHWAIYLRGVLNHIGRYLYDGQEEGT